MRNFHLCFSTRFMIAIYLAGIGRENEQQDYLKVKSRMHWSMNPMHIEIIQVVLEKIDNLILIF